MSFLSSARKIKVLIVDDSVVVRRMLSKALDADPALEVVGTAEHPYEAHDKILELKPDVLTLDIEMPRMNGLTFLKILMEKRPMPVVVMSSLSTEGSTYAMQALQLGAVDVLAKPYGSFSIASSNKQLIEKVKAAGSSKLSRRSIHKTTARANQIAPAVDTSGASGRFHPKQIVLLGASTGGTEALKEVLTALPPEMPGICVVQHIPPYFSKAFAERLDTLCKLKVKEAEDGDRLLPGQVLVAPGDLHMTVSWHGTTYRVGLNKGPMLFHQRPAVDILFKTGAEVAGRYAVAALLTGMGKDGAEGLLALKNKGAMTFGQDESSCVVYGMPKAAFDLGAVQRQLPLPQIAQGIYNAVRTFRG